MTDTEKITVSSIDELKKYGMTDISVAIGVFDGVHAGHRRLLEELITLASVTSSVPVAVTFSPHPRQILFPDHAPELLLPPEEKQKRLFQSGVRAIVTIPFDRAFAALPPERFIAETLSPAGSGLRGVCVGTHWRFGAGGSGDTALLTRLADQYGFLFRAVDEVEGEGETVSSSAIRNAAQHGDLSKAARYLGRPYTLYGKVIHGEGVASSRLDCPTANIDVCAGVLPPNGVYAARVILADGKKENAIVNIGAAPTFNSYGIKDLRRVEAHLLSGCGCDLYGDDLAVELIAFLRSEQKFSGVDALKTQIALDIKQTLTILEERKEEQG